MFGHKALLEELCCETLEFPSLFFSEELMLPLYVFLSYFWLNQLLEKRFYLYRFHCLPSTAFAKSSLRVCPESGSNPSSSSFGPCDDIYLTKRVIYAVSFMSQDSSIASDKAEAS
ncbi:hypothetical protein AVEN_57970-1 [Araneus ventricosus]|uniref:Uncharacterized protein n=1 Tax=Araneus ventricosus TaxID=182803 RepID=A0A4Y2M7C0_ARAVE|nr:hypothetical protein AVEN_57970-1 [Araneus ventricosus]